MATRKSEWLASIKPILDRDEAKKDAAALARELGDILEVKVDASPENLDELTKEFNAQLKTMGKQPIVFSEKTLRGIVSQFTNAIAQGISAGVSQVDFGAQLEELNKKREKILKAKNRANQVMKSRTRMTRLENFNINTANPLPIDGDVAKEAQQLVDVLYDSADKIDQAAEKYGKSSTYYINAVMDAQEAYNKYLRMQKTFGQMSSSQLAAIPKDVKALYAKLGSDREKYENSGGMNIPFDETFEAGKIFDSFEDLSDAFENIVDNADKYDKMLVQIDAKIEEITRKARESGGVEDGILKGAKDGLKTLNEVEAAYKRLKVDKGTKLRQQNESHIKSALDFDPDKNNVGIKTFAKDYYDAAASGDWVEEYHALLRYVKLYESYITSTNKTHQNKVTAKNNPFTPLYEQLKPMAENARNMLQNIINMGEGMPLVGMGNTDKDGTSDSSTNAANAERIAEANQNSAEAEAKAKADAEAKAKAEKEAREEAERQAQAEKEKEEGLKRQRAEEERIAKAKERAAKAAAEKVTSEEKTKALILEQKQAILEMLGASNEAGLFFNSETGDISDIVEGGAHSVETTSGAWNKASTQYDGRLHSHNYDVAAPSFSGKENDFAVWLKGFDYIKKQMILANTELLSFDFSSISRETLRHIAALYSKAAREIDKEFDGYVKNGQVGEKFGTLDNWDEQFQTRLREALNSIVEKPEYAGIMTSQQLPQDIIDTRREQLAKNQAKVVKKSKGVDGMSLADEYERANDEVKELIKNLSILYKNMDMGVDAGDELDPSIALEEKLRSIKPELLNIPSEQWDQLGQKFIDEQNTIQQEVAVTKQVVDGLNESLEKTQQLMSGDGTGTGAGTGDALSSDLEAERMKAESLRSELDQKNAEIANKDDEIQRVKSEKESAIQAANDEKQTLQNDLDFANKQNAELHERLSNEGDALWTAEQRANEAEEKASRLEKQLSEQVANITSKSLSDSSSDLGDQWKTNITTLLTRIKIHTHNTARQIRDNLVPKITSGASGSDSQHNGSYALESTLQTVKGVLDNIQTNAVNVGAVGASGVDTIAGTALDGRLIEIKSVLESINNKIAKGGVIATRGAVKQANAQPIESEAKTQAVRSNMLKSLVNDYKTLGKLSAQFASDGNLETKAMLENLKEEIARKRQSLKITMDENKSLREKYSIAFDAEKRLLDAKKAQEQINKQTSQQDKDDKDAWKKYVKDAQRATGINAATTVANAGDQTVLRAIGAEGVSKDIENKAKELSDQIKTLRVLRDEIDKKGETASAVDRDNLSKQISKVKELKTEVDGYLKIHEKYSGDNVMDLGDASNFGAFGTDQYWNNITAAIKNASGGKATIKGLKDETGELTGTTKIAANTFATWSATVDPLTGRLKMLRTGIKTTETIVEQITRKTKEIFTYFSGSSIIFKAFNELKKGVQYVRDIDLALTELKKVTDETEETYRKFLDTAAKTADKVGSTIQKVVSSTADFARLGYTLSEAATFAESAQILMNVSEFTDVSRATDTLISSVQAFGYTAETSMEVVDLLNTIGNNYAISTADLAQSLTKSSASLVAAGGDLAEAAALTATANKIIQDADSVGTALKTEFCLYVQKCA